MSVGSWALSFQGVFQIELTLCSLAVCAVYSLRFTSYSGYIDVTGNETWVTLVTRACREHGCSAACAASRVRRVRPRVREMAFQHAHVTGHSRLYDYDTLYSDTHGTYSTRQCPREKLYCAVLEQVVGAHLMLFSLAHCYVCARNSFLALEPSARSRSHCPAGGRGSGSRHTCSSNAGIRCRGRWSSPSHTSPRWRSTRCSRKHRPSSSTS